VAPVSGCVSDNKGTARSLPFAKIIEHDVLGGADWKEMVYARSAGFTAKAYRGLTS
jgi:hypothetical protein